LAAGSEAPRHFWKLTTGQKAMSPLRFATADRKFQRLFCPFEFSGADKTRAGRIFELAAFSRFLARQTG